MQKAKLSQIGFGYFSLTCETIERKNIPFSQKIGPDGSRLFCTRGNLIERGASARDQLRACVKWDLVDRDFSIFFNFVH